MNPLARLHTAIHQAIPRVVPLETAFEEHPNMFRGMEPASVALGPTASAAAGDGYIAIDGTASVFSAVHVETMLQKALNHLTPVALRTSLFSPDDRHADTLEQLVARRVSLPISTAQHESALLGEAGRWPVNGRMLDFPACKAGVSCVGNTLKWGQRGSPLERPEQGWVGTEYIYHSTEKKTTGAPPGTVRILGKWMDETEYANFVDSGVAPAADRYCVACYRPGSGIFNSIPRSATHPTKRTSPWFPNRSRFNPIAIYATPKADTTKEHVYIPQVTPWQGSTDAIVLLKTSLMTWKSGEGGRLYLNQDPLIFRRHRIAAPVIGQLQSAFAKEQCIFKLAPHSAPSDEKAAGRRVRKRKTVMARPIAAKISSDRAIAVVVGHTQLLPPPCVPTLPPHDAESVDLHELVSRMDTLTGPALHATLIEIEATHLRSAYPTMAYASALLIDCCLAKWAKHRDNAVYELSIPITARIDTNPAISGLCCSASLTSLSQILHEISTDAPRVNDRVIR